MTYRFRISLPNIKGFARVYLVNAHNTLYLFHKTMLADMDFPQDQMILFKGLDSKGNVVARYATFDLGDGSVDEVTVERALEAGITSFVYFYDTTNKRSVIVTLEGQADSETAKPKLVETKGPNPIDFINGYIAFEDLPEEKQNRLRILDEVDEDDGSVDLDSDDDDDDFDDDEQDGDDGEDGAEIYGED